MSGPQPAWRRALRRNWLNLVLFVIFVGNVVLQAVTHNFGGAFGFACAAVMAASAYAREMQAVYVDSMHDLELRMACADLIDDLTAARAQANMLRALLEKAHADLAKAHGELTQALLELARRPRT